MSAMITSNVTERMIESSHEMCTFNNAATHRETLYNMIDPVLIMFKRPTDVRYYPNHSIFVMFDRDKEGVVQCWSRDKRVFCPMHRPIEGRVIQKYVDKPSAEFIPIDWDDYLKWRVKHVEF